MFRTLFSICALLTIAACGPVSADGGGDGPDAATIDSAPACADGQYQCDGNVLSQCAGGQYSVVQTCANACNPSLGCVVCQPNTGTCNGDMGSACLPDGSGYEESYCDPVQGMLCNGVTGQCEGECATGSLAASYIGCDYYPTVTAQLVNQDFSFAVAIANTSNNPATITIDEGVLGTPIIQEVAPQSVGVIELPWVPELKMCNTGGVFGCTTPDPFQTVTRAKGAYHLRSTHPVTVYQFSPLDYTNGGGVFTYTNDASLLLPSNALRQNYVVSAWPYWSTFGYPGMMAVTATADDTEIVVTTKAQVNGTPSFEPGVPNTVTLQRGDVIQLVNLSGDLTGSSVVASKPVQVISGHYCSNVPQDIVACDHMEESMLPIETLSTDYLVTMPAVPPLPNGKEQVIRIVATEGGTNLTYEPPVAGAPTTLAAAGDFIEIPRYTGDFLVSADKKILVSQFMEGQDAGGGTGDPATTVTVPIDQYRTDYLFHAPTNYEVNYVNITAPMGASIMLDNTLIETFSPIGSTGYGVARVTLDGGLTGDGNHSVSSSEPFGILVYGYGQYTSYFYPGGLDLADIIIE